MRLNGLSKGGADPFVADLLLAGLLAVLSIAELHRPLVPGSQLRPGDPLGYLLVLAMCAPLAVRRRWPRASASAVLLLAAVVAVLGYRQTAIGLSVSVMLYTVGNRVELRRAGGVLAAAVAMIGCAFAFSREPVAATDLVQTLLTLGVAWWLGSTLRVRAAYARAMEERAALLQQVHQEAARSAVVQERVRIARELHDVVAHSMSVIAVQSGMAMHVLDSQPEQARSALETIVGTSRSALTEMRRLLGVLRQEGQPAGALLPAPGLADVPELLDQVRRAGLEVRLVRDGEPEDLPAALELTAYRIVQEALTNVVKHAGAGARATVTLRVAAGALDVEVLDSGGRGAEDPGGGAGLVGMRERVSTFGGSLETGPSGDGFRVLAHLPVTGAPA